MRSAVQLKRQSGLADVLPGIAQCCSHLWDIAAVLWHRLLLVAQAKFLLPAPWASSAKEPTTDKQRTREREASSELQSAHSRLILEHLCGGWGIKPRRVLHSSFYKEVSDLMLMVG